MTARIRNRTPVTMVSAIRYAREWDVDVLIQPDARLSNVRATHTGPVAGGIHWPSRTIVWPVDDIDGPYIAPFIHELSHVLSGLNPKAMSELDSSVLALDHAAFRFLGAPRLWNVWMANFSTEYGDWPKISKRERDERLAHSLYLAQHDGLLNDKGEPTFVRNKAMSNAA